MKRIRGDEPVIYDTYIHGNITRKLPMQLSSSQTSKNIIYLLSFFFYKIREEEGETGPAGGVVKGLAPVGAGRWQGIGGRIRCK
jgi:hypothetical protein